MNIKNKKISYIAEINLKSKSAYKQQVLKMCDAFSQKGFAVTLYVVNSNNSSFNELKKKYLLKSKFKIKKIFNKLDKLNFFLRLIFSIKLLLILKNKSELIFSRSVLLSIILSINNIKSVLEVHQPLSGFTNILFKFLKKKILLYTKFILINKNINKFLKLRKNLYLVADDGVDLKDFTNKTKVKYENTCVYTGSLFKGKGIEIILGLAENVKKINFYIYGDTKTASKEVIEKFEQLKNIKIFGHVDYNKIPNILKSHRIILMPYSKIVFGNHKNMNIARFMSPLKLFDYLAAERIILASKNISYSHILQNKKNAMLCNPSNLNDWVKAINLVFSKKLNLAKLQYNSKKTAKLYSWDNRINKIMKFINQNYI